MSMPTTPEPAETKKQVRQLSEATVRFCGDSGDGMQLAGTQFTTASALAGNDVATYPDYPAEIRAPRGTLAGVSGFQVHFASKDIFTPGDRVDAMVAMNPAALKANLSDLEKGGILIADSDAFEAKGLRQAGYDENPLTDNSLDGYQLIPVPITELTRSAAKSVGLSKSQTDRCRNFFAMGLVFWLYGRDRNSTLRFIESKFGGNVQVAEANRKAFLAGWNFGETTGVFASSFRVDRAKLAPGTYRSITGNQAMAWGLMTAAHLSDKELFLGSYPITPASDILHELSKFQHLGVRTFQAEDEIAAICAAIGAAYGGAMALTTSSGPGIALKSEAMGLAVMFELPLVIISVQRGGPSTGLPTKVEQADLFQAVFGRNGECPMPVLAARSPAECFDVAIEAWRIAVRYMTPVIVLSDAYIANGSEPWRIPDVTSLKKIPVTHPGPIEKDDARPFEPYRRDERLSRPWALPGTKGLEHRIGGLEKADVTGEVSYSPENHEVMIRLRARKIAGIAAHVPLQEVDGPERGKVLVLSWGGAYGACAAAVDRMQTAGHDVAHAHLRYLVPLPANLGELLRRYEKVLIPELNLGQLRHIIRAEYLLEPYGLNKVKGKPFEVTEIIDGIQNLLDEDRKQ